MLNLQLPVLESQKQALKTAVEVWSSQQKLNRGLKVVCSVPTEQEEVVALTEQHRICVKVTIGDRSYIYCWTDVPTVEEVGRSVIGQDILQANTLVSFKKLRLDFWNAAVYGEQDSMIEALDSSIMQQPIQILASKSLGAGL